MRVDTGVNDVRFAAFSRGGAFQGDYDQVVTVGDRSYLTYCDSWSAGSAAPATPGDQTVHHQRTMVSIVAPTAGTPVAQSKGSGAPRKDLTKAPSARAGGSLAATGLSVGVPVVAAACFLLALTLVRRRRRSER